MRLLFHDVRLALEGDARAVAAAMELLGGLPEDLPDGDPDTLLALRLGPPHPRSSGPCLLRHGSVDCHLEDGDLVVTDGASRARVPPGGRLVAVDVAEASLRDGHHFAHVLLLVSLVLALRWRGLFHLHAGALVTPGGCGVLVAGGTGAGKSTLTLALLEAGCSYLGDDAVFLATAPGAPAVLGLPRSFHVAPRTADAFPRIAPLLGSPLPAGQKRRLDPRAAWPGRERSSMGLPSAILLPSVVGGPTTSVEPLPSAEALGALIESSAYVVVGEFPRGREHLRVLRRIADAAAASRIGLGRDLLERPSEVGRRVLAAIDLIGGPGGAAR